MQPRYMPKPTTETWKQSEEMFRKMWDFPHCVAALDGKHCALQCPPKSGSRNFNWKHGFSIVLLAAVDATYKFLWVDVGRSGGSSDGGLFRSTALGQKVLDATINLPADDRIKGSNSPIAQPYVMVGDEAFPLAKHIMRPFSGRTKTKLSARKLVFNYRLSRARRLVESAFGILASRNRVFKSTSCMNPANYTKVILAAVVLHNYLCAHVVSRVRAKAERRKLDEIEDKDTPDATKPTVLRSWTKVGYHANQHAVQIRNEFCRYFYREGQIKWQWKIPALRNKKIPQLLFDAES